MYSMKDDIKSVLFTKEQLEQCVKEMGAQITKDYAGVDNLLLVTVLKGAAVFFTDLMRNIDLPLSIDFMAASSYGAGIKTSGVVKIVKDLDTPLEGRNVIIVEDILDSGVTLNYLKNIFLDRNPASIKIATLFDKPERHRVELKPDYIGLEVPDEFIVGYGLDYNEKYRNLPFVGILKPEVYQTR